MISAKEMKTPVLTKIDDEFERTIASIEKRNGFTEYYYRPGKLKRKTIEKLEKLGFSIVVLYYPHWDEPEKADYYSSYICWTKYAQILATSPPHNMRVGYATGNSEYLYENIPEKYVRGSYSGREY